MEKWERCRQILDDNYNAFSLAECTLDIIEVTYDAIAAQEREKYAVLLAAVDAVVALPVDVGWSMSSELYAALHALREAREKVR